MSELALKLLSALADGRFHSGAELGDKLAVTRSAIWKAIAKLEEMEIEVYRVKKRGYKLPFPIELLNDQKIASYMEAQIDLEILTSVGSTNDYVLAQARQGKKAPYVCLAEHQSAGRGRHNRHWDTPFGRNIALSLLWQFQLDPTELSGLNVVIAVSIIEALKTYGINDLELKWPNDVLWQQKKLAGVLVDIIAEAHAQTQVVIGVGLNLAQHKIDDPWANLELITGQLPERNRIVALLIQQFSLNLSRFTTEGLTPFLKAWRQYDGLAGKKIQIIVGEKRTLALAIGIGQKGELIYELAGEKRSLLHGTVRIAAA